MLSLWKDTTNHPNALTIIQDVFDTATFGLPESGEQDPEPRVRSAWWRNAGVELDIKLTELAALAGGRCEPFEVMHAFAFLPTDLVQPPRPSSVAEFESAVLRARAWRAAKAPSPQPWQIVLPLAQPSKVPLALPREVTVLGHRFKMQSVMNLKRPIRDKISDRRALARIVTSARDYEPPAAVVTTSIIAADADDAWAKVEVPFQLLRSTADFCLARGWGFSSHQKPRSKWPHPIWLIAFDGTGTPEGRHFEVEAIDGRLIDELRPGACNSIQRILRLFRAPPVGTDIRTLLADALRLHSDALDARFDHWAFLGFWQVLERISLVEDKGGATQDVARRISWLVGRLGLPGSGFEHTLLALGKKRNDLAHAGRVQAIGQRDVNVIKTLAEYAILNVLRNRDKLKTTTNLRAAYEHRQMNETKLDAVTAGVRIVRARRREGTPAATEGSPARASAGTSR